MSQAFAKRREGGQMMIGIRPRPTIFGNTFFNNILLSRKITVLVNLQDSISLRKES